LIEKLFQSSKVEKIINGYGLTELTAYSAVEIIRRDMIESQVSIGTPIANNRIYILNEFKQQVPIGVIGDIFVAGLGVPLVNKKTNQPMIESIQPEIGQKNKELSMFNTGDIGYYNFSGKIVSLGRRDAQIKIRGYRIDTIEVETLLRTYPGITDVAIILQNDDKIDKCLVAFYSSAGNLKSSDLFDYLSNHLPSYMVPTFFINLENLPVNNSGKIDKKALSKIPFHQNQERTSTECENYQSIIINT
jgi:acyl-coenzyme A synthetase/AMP-(fatty) acid ligase